MIFFYKVVDIRQKKAWLRLNVSNLCNFSCKYCHVFKISDNKLPSQLMSYDVMDFSINEFIDLMIGFNQKYLLVSIYGGETLLNKKNLFRVIEKYNNSYNGVDISWIVNTNGSLLTEEDALFFKNYDVDLHVSCDGYEEVHDKNRMDKFGKGTFEKVRNALALVKQNRLKAQINSFVMPENFNNLKDVVGIAKEYNISRIYLDLMYSGSMIKAEELAQKYFEIYLYGLKNNINVAGPWKIVLNNYLKKYTPEKNKLYLPPINVNVDGTFFFNNYPLIRKFNLKVKNLKKIVGSKEFPAFLNSVRHYYRKRCKDCYLCSYCFGQGISQYQYHVVKEEGYEESCNFIREIIKIFKHSQG